MNNSRMAILASLLLIFSSVAGCLEDESVEEIEDVIEDVIDLDHAVMREGTISSWDVHHRIAAPADIAGAWTVLEPTVNWSPAFILHRRMINGVVWATCKFIDVISDLNSEAVVQITGEHKNALIEFVPKFDKFLTFLQKYRPSIILLNGKLFVISSSTAHVWHHEIY